MSGDIQKIAVEIFGERHIIRGEGEPDYIRELAYEVDKKMHLIAQRLPRLAVHQVAILAALNLADELQKLKQEHESLLQLLDEKD